MFNNRQIKAIGASVLFSIMWCTDSFANGHDRSEIDRLWQLMYQKDWRSLKDTYPRLKGLPLEDYQYVSKNSKDWHNSYCRLGRMRDGTVTALMCLGLDGEKLESAYNKYLSAEKNLSEIQPLLAYSLSEDERERNQNRNILISYIKELFECQDALIDCAGPEAMSVLRQRHLKKDL